MAKYNVGDKVRLIDNEWAWWSSHTGIVMEVVPGMGYRIKTIPGALIHFWSEAEIAELVVEPWTATPAKTQITRLVYTIFNGDTRLSEEYAYKAEADEELESIEIQLSNLGAPTAGVHLRYRTEVLREFLEEGWVPLG